MNKEIKKLWEEKKELDNHSENPVLQAREMDCIAAAILRISEETTELTAEDIEAVNWAKKRLGV